MKLNILIQGAGYQLSGEASSLTEFVELRNFLRSEGLISTTVPQQGSAASQDTKVEKDAGKAEEVKKAEPEKKAEDKPKAEKPKAAKAAAATAKTVAGPTIEEVTAALTAVADKFGIQEALAMNQRFGVKKAGELNSEQYADYIAFANGCVADDRKPSQAQEDNASENEDDVASLV